MESISTTDWEIIPLSQLTENIQYGYTAKASKEQIGPKMLRITDIQDGNVCWESVPFCSIELNKIPKFLLEDGDLLFARTGATVGKSYLIRGRFPDSVFASYLIRITPKPEIIPEYLYFYFQSSGYWNQIQQEKRGIGQPNVNASILSNLQIPVAPLVKQKQIVNLLESVRVKTRLAKQELSRIPNLTRRLRMAILSKAFRGELGLGDIEQSGQGVISTETLQRSHTQIIKNRKDSGKKVHSKLSPLREDDLPSIPTNWTWARFEEVVFVIDYRGRTPPYSSKGIPHLRSANIRNGEVQWDNIRYVTKETYDTYMVRGLPESNDILFTTEAPLGEVAFVPDKIFSLAQRVVVLKPSKDLLDSKFLFYQIMSNQFRSRLFRQSTGTTVKGIAYRNLRKMGLAIPPLEEQRKIVKTIEPQLRLIETISPFVDDTVEKLENLERRILSDAFRGNYTQHYPSARDIESETENAFQSRIDEYE